MLFRRSRPVLIDPKWTRACFLKHMSTTQTALAPVKGFTRRNLMILLLSVAGGGVDAIIISGFQVLTAAQTGNTVLLAVALAQGRFSAGFYSAVSVVAFVVGSVASVLVMIKRKSESALSPLGWALIVEFISLGALLAGWHFQPHPGPKWTAVLIALAASAMGIQSAAVLRIHGSPSTTYVTGTLSKFSADLTIWLFDRKAGALSMPPQHQTASSSSSSSSGRVLYGLDWLVYLLGGVASALLFLSVREMALALPMMAIGLAALAEPRQPQ